jgi:membrane associated rhomboid family serine protease
MNSSGGLFSNAGRNLAQLRHSPVSWMLFGTAVGIQILVDAAGGVDVQARWYEILGLSRSGFLSGRVWQLLTHGLLHGAWWHAGLNAVFVLLIGSRIEFIAGRSMLIGVTLAGVLGGGIAHLMIGSGLLVGLSGGCIALLLCLTTLSPQSRMFPLPVSGRSLGLGILLAELMLALIDPGLGLPGFSSIGEAAAAHGMASWFQLGHACHFGGGLAGWLCGRWMLRPRVTLERLRRERARREAG